MRLCLASRKRVQPRNRMRKNCTSGSVRGAPGNRRPYRGGLQLVVSGTAPRSESVRWSAPRVLRSGISQGGKLMSALSGSTAGGFSRRRFVADTSTLGCCRIS